VSAGGSGPPVSASGTNVVSVTGNQTVALTDQGDQITGNGSNNNITVTGSPNTGDFVDGGAGSDTLTLGAEFSAVPGSGLGVKNIETLTMTGNSNKIVVFAPYDAGSATVSISADGNGGDRYLTSDGNAQNQILNFSGLNGLKTGDVVDLGGGTGDKVVLAGVANVASLSNVEFVITGSATDEVSMTSSAGSTNLISATGGDTYNLTNSAGNDVIAFSSAPGGGFSPINVTGFAAGDKLRFERDDWLGDANSDGAIDSGKLVSGAGVVTASDSDDFWIFNTTDKKLRYDADGNGSSSSPIVIIDFDDTSTITGAAFEFVANNTVPTS